MEHNVERDDASTNDIAEVRANARAATSTTEGQPLILEVLKMLEPYTKKASIELNNNQKVSVQEEGDLRTILHCGENETSCKHVVPLDGVGLCQKFSQLQNGQGPIQESEQTRQLVVDLIAETIRALHIEEKVKLLLSIGEEEFGAYVERNDDLEKLQSIQYKFTRRVNALKTKSGHKSPKRPVIEQRKVGDYLYKRQAGPKGGVYWYLQFTKDGKRCHIYLGKDNPKFKPDIDLARKQNRKSRPQPTT